MDIDEEITELMDQGLTWDEVCAKLHISRGTLGDHMKRLHKHGYPYRMPRKGGN